MATPLTGDIVELVIEADFDDTEDVLNVYQFEIGTSGFADVEDFLDNVEELVLQILAVIDGLVTAYTIWRRFRVRNLTQGGSGWARDLVPTVPGTVAGESLPAGISMLFGFRTEESGVLLRKFIGVPGESMTAADGAWTSAAASSAVAFLTLLLAPITSTISAWYFGHWHVSTATFLLPGSGYVNLEPAYQRRRRRGTGQ